MKNKQKISDLHLFNFLGIGILITAIVLTTIGTPRLAGDPGTLTVTGIPAPYNFRYGQGLRSGENLRVGGDGDFHISSFNRGSSQSVVADVDLNGVYFVSPEEGWVVGQKGEIYRTSDRGESWTKQSSNVEGDLMGIDCLNRLECWVVGEKGLILKTADGSRWSMVDSGIETDLTAVDFLNEKIGIAVGSKGTVISTTDGGRTWQKQRIVGGEKNCGDEFVSKDQLADVTIVDEEVAWIAGNGGVAKYVSSKGIWEGICLSDIIAPVGVVSQNGRDVFVVGSYGTNLVSHDSGKSWKRYDEFGIQGFRVLDETGRVLINAIRKAGDKDEDSSYTLPKGTLTIEVSLDGKYWARIAERAVFEKPVTLTVRFG